ncbi:class I SAM-dependent methyltransferase [Sinomonas albida]|uniref:class I SAM-dependent methyltransferase n=1 Tax=Sinomonas albida TaxID=369942 RepID=UPI003017133F
MNAAPSGSAEYFDGWYANMVGSTRRDELKQRYLGLPAHLLSTSLLPWEGIADVVGALRLSPGCRLLDLACGRGGYGLEVARRAQARLVGVDFSREAVRQAADAARAPGVEAEFRVGELSATGLPDASVDALMCIDSIQFEATEATYRELRRVLAAGGRSVITSWEALDRSDESVPERLRLVDLRAGLEGAGFLDVEVREPKAWRAAERNLWLAAAELDPAEGPDVRSLHDEAIRTLEGFDRIRRVFAVVTAP